MLESPKVLLWDLKMARLWGFVMVSRSVVSMVSEREFELGYLLVFGRELAMEFV